MSDNLTSDQTPEETTQAPTEPSAQETAPVEVPQPAHDSVPEADPIPERLGAVSIIVETEEDVRRKEQERRKREEEKKRRDEAFEVVKSFKESNSAFEVDVVERVKGGLRGDFNGLRNFIPASHASGNKTATEAELNP